MAAVVAGAVVADAGAAAAVEVEDDADPDEAIPLSVPACIAAELDDSLFAAAIAAMLAATGLVLEEPAELGFPLVSVLALFSVLALLSVLVLMSVPPAVANTAGAPATLLGGEAAEGVGAVAAVAGVVDEVVLPRVGTDAGGPVEPVLM
jgi:hypothetical protein